MSAILSSFDQVQNILETGHNNFRAILYKGQTFLFPYVKFIAAKAAIEKIINILIVDLNVLALHFKINITYVLIFKHGIVVVKTLSTI